MKEERFDLAVIGAGPGGYVAAIKAAQNGKSVALIEKKYLGGTCLNVGCIPTKTLISNATVLEKIRHAKEFGIETGAISFDYAQMKQRKDSVVEKIRKSLEGLIKTNKITILRGVAEFVSPTQLKVKGEDNLLVSAEKIIIASGSEPLDIPAFPCDHKKIVNSSSILDWTTLPNSLVVIGGGYIGCEFASLYAELGVKITILEALESIVILQGKAVATTLTEALKKKGIEIRTGVFVEGIDQREGGITVRLKGGEKLDFDAALISVGRKVVSKELQLEKAGVLTDPRGAIPVNDKMETNVPGIYAIGDVTGRVMLAHVASHQGIIAAANATGQEAHMHYNAVPAVIFTHPEIATVGMTLEEAQKEGYQAAIGKFPFSVLAKSIASIETEGFAEIIIDKKTGEILGAQVVGHEASALIGEIAVAITNELTIDCISETIHAHPTIAEGWLEAALIAQDTPIHFPPRRK
jgi:dihydrolipoyl dehydrogenase